MSEVIERDDLWTAACVLSNGDRLTSGPSPFWQIHIWIGEQYEEQPEIDSIKLYCQGTR